MEILNEIIRIQNIEHIIINIFLYFLLFLTLVSISLIIFESPFNKTSKEILNISLIFTIVLISG